MPGGAVLNFIEPHQYQERIRPARLQIVPTERGTFQATLSQVELDRLTLQHGWQNLSLVARAALNLTRIAVIFHPDDNVPEFRADGVDQSPDLLLQVAPGDEHIFRMPAECAWAAVTVTPETYRAARVALAGDDGRASIQSDIIRPLPAAMARLRLLHRSTTARITGLSEPNLYPEIVRSMEHSLLTTLIDCLLDDDNIVLPRLGSRNSTIVMRRLYELLDMVTRACRSI